MKSNFLVCDWNANVLPESGTQRNAAIRPLKPEKLHIYKTKMLPGDTQPR